MLKTSSRRSPASEILGRKLLDLEQSLNEAHGKDITMKGAVRCEKWSLQFFF